MNFYTSSKERRLLIKSKTHNRLNNSKRVVSSVVRALASHARGPRFKSSTAHHLIDAIDHTNQTVVFNSITGFTRCRSGGTVDALRSGRSTPWGVWVQIPPSAPYFCKLATSYLIKSVQRDASSVLPTSYSITLSLRILFTKSGMNRITL